MEKNVNAMLNLDIAGSGDSLALIGTPALVHASHVIAKNLSIPVTTATLPHKTSSDHESFLGKGIPVMFRTVIGATIHTPMDTFSRIDPLMLNQVGTLAHAILGCLIAKDEKSLPVFTECAREKN